MLDGVEESTRRPICICFYSISTPCPQKLSGKSLLNSLLGAAKGGRGWAGIEGSSLTVCQRLPRGGLHLPPAACRVRTGCRAQEPSPSAPPGAGICSGLRALESSGQDARAGLRPPPRKFWSGAGSQASCLYSPQPLGEIPGPLFAAQRPCWLFKCAQAEFRQNLNVTLTKNK